MRKEIGILIGSSIAITAIIWLATRFGSGESVTSEEHRVICQNKQCFWTAHIHATVKVFVRGKEVAISFEQGNLEQGHTHAQPNRLHWHGLIPVDPGTKEVTNWSALEVANLPQNLKLTISGTPRYVANGKAVEQNYIWQDGDTIEIRYE